MRANSEELTIGVENASIAMRAALRFKTDDERFVDLFENASDRRRPTKATLGVHLHLHAPSTRLING
jgi:hypothetical protein